MPRAIRRRLALLLPLALFVPAALLAACPEQKPSPQARRVPQAALSSGPGVVDVPRVRGLAELTDRRTQ